MMTRRLLAPLRQRIKSLIGFARGRAVKTSGPLQTFQLERLHDELLDAVDYLEAYGMTAAPPPGFDALTVSLDGQRRRTACVHAWHTNYRPSNIKQGEVCLYTDEGDRVWMQRGRVIAVTAGKKIAVTAPDIEADCTNCNVVASDAITATCATLTATASQQTDIISPIINLDGVVNVSGLLTVAGGLAVSGGTGATVAGSLVTTGGDVVADGISLKDHTHPYTDDGTARTTGEAL